LRKSVLALLVLLLGVSAGFLLWTSNHAQHTKHVPAKARGQYEDASSGHDGGIGGNLLQRDPCKSLRASPAMTIANRAICRLCRFSGRGPALTAKSITAEQICPILLTACR